MGKHESTPGGLTLVNCEELERKKELILEREVAFSYQIGAAVLEKPKVSVWMVLIPILFLHFFYQMQRHKSGFVKFAQDFMITRRLVMDLAVEALEKDAVPDIDQVVRQSSLPDDLKIPYESWVRVLVEYYTDLLTAEGSNFESLVQSAYSSQTNYLLALNRLSMAEKEFYSGLKIQMTDTEGSRPIIEAIEERSQSLRRELAQQIFAPARAPR
jgi:hypothetical protein